MEDLFVSSKDKESWTQEQKDQHYLNVCQEAGLDPKLGLLRWMKLDDGTGTGTKRLVLYATKGATNAIRARQGIDIVSLTDKVVASAYIVTATAKNVNNRTDIAQGVASIDGKCGRALENAITIAQTRAVRRVTLQIAGLDLLDESEVTNDGTVSLASTPDDVFAAVSQPVPVASSEPGADVTAPLGIVTPATPLSQANAAPVAASNVEERIPNPAAGLKLAPGNMAGPGVARVAAAPVVAAKTEYQVTIPPHVGENVALVVPAGIPEVNVSVQTQSEVPAARPRRKRRTKAEMEAARAAEIPGLTVEALGALPAVNEAPTPVAETITVTPAPKAAVPLVGSLPTSEQMTGYVARLKAYREDILPNAGGMIPSNGLSVRRKMILFFSVVNNGNDDLTKLTTTQWDSVLNYMDHVVKTDGATKLVEIMELNIAQIGEQNVQQSS